MQVGGRLWDLPVGLSFDLFKSMSHPRWPDPKVPKQYPVCAMVVRSYLGCTAGIVPLFECHFVFATLGLQA
jgi:hypothetical protein